LIKRTRRTQGRAWNPRTPKIPKLSWRGTKSFGGDVPMAPIYDVVKFGEVLVVGSA
jgi:hypothetical protein